MKINEFIGQTPIIKDLQIHLHNAMLKTVPLEHMMLYGLPGLGKTTISQIISKELNTALFQRTGQDLSREILSEVLQQIFHDDIFFIDEIHSTPKRTLELLYGPLQIINDMKLKGEVDQFYFEGMHLCPFTLIGATTHAGLLEKPLRDRIILSYNLTPYSMKELCAILDLHKCPSKPATMIAKRSRGIPRIALNYFVRIRNSAITADKITPTICKETFQRLEIDDNGFTTSDIAVLKYLAQNGVSSEATIYKSLNIDQSEYSQMLEPFLLHNNMIQVTSRGREITKKGLAYIDWTV